MDKLDVKIAKKKILKCLTENFEYGKTKTGKPLKRKKKNHALFDKSKGHQMYNNTDLYMVMECVVLGLYLSIEDSKNASD